ncbi:MAG: ABC transporter permease [Actinomycetota bacterium]
MRRVIAQSRLELTLTIRRGESLLVAIIIPVGILAFFSTVDVLPHDGRAIDFLTPGVLALAVISSAMTNLSIATGFERQTGVLRRLGTTPLGRSGLLVAKTVTLIALVVLQVAVVVGAAFALGWSPRGGAFASALALALGTAAFAGLGFLLAGRLRAETNLAVANGLFLVFLLLGGIVVPLSRLPDGIANLARVLPAEPLATALRSALADASFDVGSVAVLAVWAVVTCSLAALTFRWD